MLETHGKGFSIVAEEVGNLAKMSGQASRDISEILSESSTKVDNIVESINKDIAGVIEEGNNRVSTGLHLADNLKDKLNFVVENVGHMKGMMDNVDTAAKEQAEGIENIAVAMEEIDQATHVNNDAANKTSESSDVLKSRSEELSGIVLDLTSLITGNESYGQDHVPKEKVGAGLPVA